MPMQTGHSLGTAMATLAESFIPTSHQPLQAASHVQYRAEKGTGVFPTRAQCKGSCRQQSHWPLVAAVMRHGAQDKVHSPNDSE